MKRSLMACCVRRGLGILLMIGGVSGVSLASSVHSISSMEKGSVPLVAPLLLRPSSTPGAALPTTAHQVARVLDIKTKALLFTVDRQEVLKGPDRKRQVTETFLSPEGSVAARATVLLQGADQVLKYDLDKVQTGEKGEITVQGNQIHFEFKDQKGRIRKADEKLEGNFVVGLSIRSLVEAHWEDLLAGETVKMRFGVLERLETVGFDLFKERETQDAKGREVVIFKMKPSSIFIAALVKPLLFVFSKADSKLLEFTGRTLPYRKVGDRFEDLDAVTIYSD